VGARVPDPGDPVAKASAGSNPAPRIDRGRPRPLRRAELVRRLERVPAFAEGKADLEQVATPAEAAAELLGSALAGDDLVGRTVADLGCGTGRLAIGAALLGARSVTGVELDPKPLEVARAAAQAAGVAIEWQHVDVRDWRGRFDTVVMNPPFGAQRKGADRPFLECAFESAGRAVYAFELAASRSFIARRAVERGAYVEATREVPWELPRVFPHHRHARVPIAVDLWVIRTDQKP
jgi:putative methylase